jgi:hypothetical protein
MHFIFSILLFSFAAAFCEEAPIEESSAVETQDALTEECAPIPEESEPFCYFIPPKGWAMAEPNLLGPQVKMAFVKIDKKRKFCPSLNLAIEKVEGGLNAYLNDVKVIHEQDRKNHWRKLGKVHTLAGEAQLTEIDTSSHMGAVRMLQLILLKEGRAYILTAAALKEDFCDFYQEFQSAFRSLTISEKKTSLPN